MGLPLLQGLVLDCKPLQMEPLDVLPLPTGHLAPPWPVWLVLDEVSDPVSSLARYLKTMGAVSAGIAQICTASIISIKIILPRAAMLHRVCLALVCRS